MANPGHLQELDQAFDQIEKVILPGISILIETLLDEVRLARSGTEGDDFPAELHILALQLEAVTRQVEMLSLVRFETGDYRLICAADDRRISA